MQHAATSTPADAVGRTAGHDAPRRDGGRVPALPLAPAAPGASVSTSRLLAALLTFGMLASLGLAFASVLQGERGAEHGRQLLLKAADQQLLVQQMAGAARGAALGHESAFAELGELSGRFSRSQNELVEGLSSDLLHSPETVRGAAEAVTASWDSLRTDLSMIAAAEQDMLWFRELARATRRQLYELQGASQRTAELLTQLDAEPRSVFDAALQLTRVQAMIEALDDTLAGGSQAARSIELAIASADEYEVALGDLRVPRTPPGEVRAPALRGALDEARLLYREMRNNAEALAALLPAVLPALRAAETVQTDERMAEEGLDDLMLALRGATGRPTFGGVPVGTGTALLFAAAALAFLGLLGLQQLMQSRRRERASMTQNCANREAIERLIDEMGELADGDLTVRATVTDEVTGAIAESVNYAVEALRALVATINATSEKLNDSAQRTREAATRLARGSDVQANQIDAASGSIAAMTAAIDEIARNAGESAAVASRAVLVAGRGAQAVRDTIDGMSRISGPIQETSRRIKRLGNSSQEIGEIVELIDDIADQTNILALNAAMQAAMAGDAGRGFAVVADEVQRLAERSSNATKQIEAIVRTIRSDTGEAVRSMETSMSGVVAGTKVAENAGTALREIENVSNYIADLTRRIADSAGNESRAAAKVNDTVKSLLDITQQTAQGTRTTAESVEALAALADELRHSVAGFRLPRG